MERYGLPSALKDGCVLFIPRVVSSTTSRLADTSFYNDANLVRYYTMDDLTEKNGNTLTNFGATVTAGRFGNAFAGTGTQYLTNTASTGITNGVCSISLWGKVSGNHPGNDHPQLANTSDEGTDVMYGIGFNQTNTQIRFSRLKQRIAWQEAKYSFTPNAGDWNHYVMTYDGTNIRGYLNGSLVAGPTPASGNGSGTTPTGVSILSRSGSDLFNGAADDVAIFNRVLSGAEVASLYGQMVAYDASGNGNHGTLVNSPTPTRGGLYGYNGLKFNGSNQYVNLGTSNFGVTGDFSIFVTAKCSSLNAEANMLGKDGPSGGRDFQFRFNSNGTITLFRGDTANGGYCDFSTSKSFNDGNYHRIGVTFSSTQGSKIWVDGVVRATNGVLTGKAWSSSNLQIAARGDSINLFTGILSNVYVNTSALSPDKVRLDASTFFIP